MLEPMVFMSMGLMGLMSYSRGGDFVLGIGLERSGEGGRVCVVYGVSGVHSVRVEI